LSFQEQQGLSLQEQQLLWQQGGPVVSAHQFDAAMPVPMMAVAAPKPAYESDPRYTKLLSLEAQQRIVVNNKQLQVTDQQQRIETALNAMMKSREWLPVSVAARLLPNAPIAPQAGWRNCRSWMQS
jgi:hypothetical protein